MEKTLKKHRVIVHFDSQGEVSYYVEGGSTVDLFIVDECAPNDRVYQWNPRASSEAMDTILGDSAVGSDNDDRHEAIKARVLGALDGRSHLSPVSDT